MNIRDMTAEQHRKKAVTCRQPVPNRWQARERACDNPMAYGAVVAPDPPSPESLACGDLHEALADALERAEKAERERDELRAELDALRATHAKP